MKQDANKTNTQLLDELRELRQRNTELETTVSNLKGMNKLLQEREERFRSIANYTADWESWVGTDGGLLWVNSAVEKFTGYSVEEYLNLPDRLKQIIWEGDRDRILSHVENGVQKHQTDNDVEFQIRCKDGSLKWVSVSYQPMYSEKGEYLGLRSSIRDISKRKLTEHVLRESQERFRAIAESSPDAIFITDSSGTILYCNKSVERMYGYTADELVGKSIEALEPERERPQYRKIREKYNENQLTFLRRIVEGIALHKDGTEFPIEAATSCWKIADQLFFSGIVRDITKRKQREEALRESEERFRSVAESSADGICIIGQNNTIDFWNSAAKEMFGYEETEVLGKSYSMLIPERLGGQDHGIRQNFLSTGRLTQNKKPFETMALRKDGSEFPIEATYSGWTIKGQHSISAIIRDITERKQQEQALRERAEQFRAIAESSPDAFVTADSSGKILYWNKAAEIIFGYQAEEIMGKSVEVLRPKGKRFDDRKNRERFISTGDTSYVKKTQEGIGVRKDGTKVPVEISNAYWSMGDQIIFNGIVRDITQRKQMEEQLRKSHAELEKKVKQRTAALKEANDKLQISQDHLKKFSGMLLSAREEERKNISTTLHDELGTMALSVNSQISIAKEECNENNKQATIKALQKAQAALRKAVEDLRRLAVDLRPPNLEIIGLAASLTDFIDKIKQQTKLKIIFRNELGNRKIPEDTAIGIYRVTQEALTNITKHAKAKNVRVRLYADKKSIRIDIADDGKGFDIDKIYVGKGILKIGIEGMRERVESLGGGFSITSAPKRGTHIGVILPEK